MKQILILLATFFTTICFSQVTFTNKIVKIETTANPDAIDHFVVFQNLDNITENVSFWSDSGIGEWTSPYCNVRVSRTYFDSDLIAHSEWSIDFTQEPVSISVAAMPGNKVLIDVIGGDFEVFTRHVAYGGSYTMYENSTQFWPIASLSEGKHTLFIPYRIRGQQGAIFKVKRMSGCDVTAGRIFYLN